MKYLPLIILVLVLIYLNRAYSYFYQTIGQANLQPPFKQTATYRVGADQGGKVLKYIALGDSLSSGVGSNNYTQTMPYILAQKLSQNSHRPIEIINLSHPGAKTTDLIQEQLPQALNENPDFISLLIGINDIHDLSSSQKFSQDFELILSQLKASHAKLIIFNLPYLGSRMTVLFPFNLLLDYQTQRYNWIIAKICLQNQLKFIDLYSFTKPAFASDDNLYSADYFHPSNQGYIFWGQALPNEY